MAAQAFGGRLFSLMRIRQLGSAVALLSLVTSYFLIAAPSVQWELLSMSHPESGYCLLA
jgi:hypothetical protein